MNQYLKRCLGRSFKSLIQNPIQDAIEIITNLPRKRKKMRHIQLVQLATELHISHSGLALVGLALNRHTSLKKSLCSIVKWIGIPNIEPMVREYDLTPERYTISGYSAHVDQHNFVKRMRYKLTGIRRIYGDAQATASLVAMVRMQLVINRVTAP
jgi:predicted metal-dependent RNase